MKIEYRIVERNGKHYPQVRVKAFPWRSKWRRIGTHPNGQYGLYDDFRYSVSAHNCPIMIKDFHQWFLNEQFPIGHIPIV